MSDRFWLVWSYVGVFVAAYIQFQFFYKHDPLRDFKITYILSFFAFIFFLLNYWSEVSRFFRLLVNGRVYLDLT